ncbi:hypothetical protein LCGC14_2265900 [marine sediment metagenome]|uniref:Uncharacterized protein n=1 Tax=marine sediment metagenome TaxID=412755 RepID=A0A0F9FAQ3_9ZZZZ
MAEQREHLSGVKVCWCNPQLAQACPDCENGEGLQAVAAVIVMAPFVDCWRCNGHGLVEPYDDSEPKILVHTNVPG